MRQALTLFLVLSIALHGFSAALIGYDAKVSGSSAGVVPVGADGRIDTRDESHLTFSYSAGRSWEVGKYHKGSLDVPYGRVDRFVYGETKNLRVGQTIVLSAVAGVGGLLLLLSKSRTHYLSIYYKDDAENEQVMGFEISKSAIRPLIESMEVRTGKKLELEAGPEAHADIKP